MSWIQSMMSLVSSEELANDVTGAEALLERHQVSGILRGVYLILFKRFLK